jgi:hypothetical protein
VKDEGQIIGGGIFSGVLKDEKLNRERGEGGQVRRRVDLKRESG